MRKAKDKKKLCKMAQFWIIAATFYELLVIF